MGNDLGITINTLEQWIEEFHQDQVRSDSKYLESSEDSSIPKPAGLMGNKSVDCEASDATGEVIDGFAIRKPR